MADSARSIDVAALINGRKLTGFNYRLIVLSWLITLFDGFDMMMIGFTAPYMQTDIGLSKMMLGNVFSAGLAGMMLGGFVFSFLGDRIGRRPTVIVAAFAFGFLTLATAFVQTYPQLLTLRFLDGLAIGGMLPLAWALNIEFVPSRMRSTVVTIIMMGYSLGTASAGPVTVALAPHFGWPSVYIAGGVGTLICAVLLLINLPESMRFLIVKGRRPDVVAATLNKMIPSLGATAQDRFTLSDEAPSQGAFKLRQLFAGDLARITPLLWIAYIASSMAIYFSASWGPIVLEELHIPRNTAALAQSAGQVLGAAAGLLLMRFTDRFGPRTVAFYPLLAIPILLLMGFGNLPIALFLPLAVVGLSLVSGEHFGVLSIAGIFYPSAIRASGAGSATSIAKIGAILGPIIGAAVLSSQMQIVHAYALLAICPVVIAICAVGIALVVRARPPVPLPSTLPTAAQADAATPA